VKSSHFHASTGLCCTHFLGSHVAPAGAPKSFTTGVIISRRPAKSTLRRLKHTFQMSSQNGRDRLGVAKGKDKPSKKTKKLLTERDSACNGKGAFPMKRPAMPT
jgi:hypothetical protein